MYPTFTTKFIVRVHSVDQINGLKICHKVQTRQQKAAKNTKLRWYQGKREEFLLVHFFMIFRIS